MGLFSKKKKTIKLEFCTNNLNQFYDDEAFDLLESFVDQNQLNIKEMDCLSFCDECTCTPYALLNSKFIEAETPEQLIMKIKEYQETTAKGG